MQFFSTHRLLRSTALQLDAEVGVAFDEIASDLIPGCLIAGGDPGRGAGDDETVDVRASPGQGNGTGDHSRPGQALAAPPVTQSAAGAAGVLATRLTALLMCRSLV
jgi:hypothetical protein